MDLQLLDEYQDFTENEKFRETLAAAAAEIRQWRAAAQASAVGSFAPLTVNDMRKRVGLPPIRQSFSADMAQEHTALIDDPLTKIVFEWGVRSFGADHMTSIPVRALRLAEEVVELAQACRVEQEKLHKLIDVVYSRPVGDPIQEMGGVMVCLSVLVVLFSTTTQEAFLREILRVLSKRPEDFAKRNQDKLDLGLT